MERCRSIKTNDHNEMKLKTKQIFKRKLKSNDLQETDFLFHPIEIDAIGLCTLVNQPNRHIFLFIKNWLLLIFVWVDPRNRRRKLVWKNLCFCYRWFYWRVFFLPKFTMKFQYIRWSTIFVIPQLSDLYPSMTYQINRIFLEEWLHNQNDRMEFRKLEIEN